MPDKRDYYDILGVSKGATDEQLKIAFRKKYEAENSVN